jgi:hypothetical protein
MQDFSDHPYLLSVLGINIGTFFEIISVAILGKHFLFIFDTEGLPLHNFLELGGLDFLLGGLFLNLHLLVLVLRIYVKKIGINGSVSFGLLVMLRHIIIS